MIRFAPMLIQKDGSAAIEFYKKAFAAVLLRRFDNPDGTVHVAELSLDDSIFHIREESEQRGQLSPHTLGGITAIINVFKDDPDDFVQRAVSAGAKVLNPVIDYPETGYRQGTIEDPFGHRWSVLKRISD